MNFASHIQSICKKASSKIAVLSRLKNMIPINARLHIYKAATLSNPTYCHTIWHFCRKLEKIQKRALHIVFNSNSFTHDELLKKSNLSTLHNRRLQRYFNNCHFGISVQ